MSKQQWIGAVAALAMTCVITSPAAADSGAIDSSTLAAMGLGDAVIVSDAESGVIRGQGFRPFSLAFGGSFATVGSKGAGAGTVNGYLRVGRYRASGENFSEAGKRTSKTVTKRVFGVPVASITTTKSVQVFAGGSSSSYSF